VSTASLPAENQAETKIIESSGKQHKRKTINHIPVSYATQNEQELSQCLSEPKSVLIR
jgi:hypothetical protein